MTAMMATTDKERFQDIGDALLILLIQLWFHI